MSAALHPMRRHELIALGIALMVAVLLAGLLGGALAARQAHDQSVQNQHHIDCIIGISAFGSGRIAVLPENCVEVRERMTRAGVLPEHIAPLATVPTRVSP